MQGKYDMYVYIATVLLLLVGFGDHILFNIAEEISPFDGFIHYIIYFSSLVFAEIFTVITPFTSIILNSIILIPFAVYKATENLYIFYAVALPLLVGSGWYYDIPLGNGGLTTFEAALIIAAFQLAHIVFKVIFITTSKR